MLCHINYQRFHIHSVSKKKFVTLFYEALLCDALMLWLRFTIAEMQIHDIERIYNSTWHRKKEGKTVRTNLGATIFCAKLQFFTALFRNWKVHENEEIFNSHINIKSSKFANVIILHHRECNFPTMERFHSTWSHKKLLRQLLRVRWDWGAKKSVIIKNISFAPDYLLSRMTSREEIDYRFYELSNIKPMIIHLSVFKLFLIIQKLKTTRPHRSIIHSRI